MMRRIGRLLGFGLLAYAVVCLFMYLAQYSLLYHPTPEVASDGAVALRLSHDGETLKIWKIGDGRDAVIYFGGNAENVAGNIPRFTGAFPDTAVYLVNYRGYGGSTGTPREAALYRDAAFVFDYVAARHSAPAAIGRSLGSGVAVWLAAARPVSRLVLITPYDSVERVAQSAYPFVPVSFLIKDRYPSIERASDVDAPTLILVAAEDTVIPNHHSLALAGAFDPDQLRLRSIGNTDHNSISRSPLYMQLIGEFLAGPDTMTRVPDGLRQPSMTGERQ